MVQALTGIKRLKITGESVQPSLPFIATAVIAKALLKANSSSRYTSNRLQIRFERSIL